MSSLLFRYFAALVALIALDAVWLTLVAQPMFRATLGGMLLDSPRWSAVGLFYLLYALGICVFAVSPALRGESWMIAIGYGALFGLLAYMTYDLTNLGTLKPWTVTLAITDIAWGTVLSALAAAAGYAAATMFATGV
jgi:uncharacterized membrane protein